ncbi:MAG: hypothetical protein E6G94_01660 [Alphaproteobacteria bacterium]|nr:MAG: hypothetical protein E6G94_01660 [Alphaproteobacteria bacterium]
MLNSFAFLALLAAPAAPPPAAAPFLDWRALSRDSARVESEQLRKPAEMPSTLASRTDAIVRGRALGDRVGQIVAAGDCDEGERQARAAGDIALANAVRNYCYKR